MVAVKLRQGTLRSDREHWFAALVILLVNEIVLKTVSNSFLESNLLENSVCHSKLGSFSMAAVLQGSFAVPLGSSENSVVS